MCGIIGYIGNRSAAPILLAGLRRLEYRGYDSAGIAILPPGPGIQFELTEEQYVPIRSRSGRVIPESTYEMSVSSPAIQRLRAVGKIDSLAEKLKHQPMTGVIGIAHTRWATHGGVTEANAHPHFALNGKLVLAIEKSAVWPFASKRR